MNVMNSSVRNKSFLTLAALAAFALMTVAVFAADPSGTWKWIQQGRGGGGGGTPRESTLMLTMNDGKLAGKLSSPRP